ncbi:M20/M25/M40 family metallo-hydrolase [Chitinophaga sp. GCM10012297]|uniref:M20/M25/M40 family metallo-hydrolase n=1 Tax=Chitinophaga chungangae TaxID=2821488 RepID=A0ABS3YEK6_9BACT|nr:M20/M25/M40 family metallo-hydrolase [Chitinophaga chungangae]MBO9152890.1 M20/M25/M40 family metallo-hydrolase [Chitinophaga chungangae]
MRYILASLSLFVTLAAHAQIDSTQLMKDVKTLSADKMEGRKTGSKGNRLAQFYLLDRLKQLKISQFSNTFEQPFYFNRGQDRIMGTNLYGYIPGRVDSFIVISAHYDHVGTRKTGNTADSIFNGADDNASGVATLLAIAKYYKDHPPKYNLIFALFDAEEMGLQGAKAFVARPPAHASKIVLNINMDMVSHNDKNELYVCGTTPYPALKAPVTAAAARSEVNLPLGHDKTSDGSQNWIPQSDHYEFHKAKIPFLYFGVEDHADYHKVTDEFEKINLSFFYRAAGAVLEVVKEFNK